MTIARSEIMAALTQCLSPEQFSDYCPNGLQVEGSDTVAHIVSGVTACQDLIDQAILLNADMLLVHHGYFWKGEEQAIVGIKRKRIKALLDNNINLVAYHLPLDFHQQLGNNASLAKKLNFSVTGTFGEGAKPLGLVGRLQNTMSGSELAAHLQASLGREPQHIAAGRDISTVAWCTGAAQGFIEQIVPLNVDAYISGEISEPTVHIAREAGIHYFGAGHHATERYGVQALGEMLATEFGVKHTFVDVPNPV